MHARSSLLNAARPLIGLILRFATAQSCTNFLFHCNIQGGFTVRILDSRIYSELYEKGNNFAARMSGCKMQGRVALRILDI